MQFAICLVNNVYIILNDSMHMRTHSSTRNAWSISIYTHAHTHTMQLNANNKQEEKKQASQIMWKHTFYQQPLNRPAHTLIHPLWLANVQVTSMKRNKKEEAEKKRKKNYRTRHSSVLLFERPLIDVNLFGMKIHSNMLKVEVSLPLTS